MEEAAKETVIIVHGTYAAPKPGVSRWYQWAEGVPATEFITKLNDALQKRGSAARCWAHCSQADQGFHWSGENSWIDRTRAASELGNYVLNLRKGGWLCHIVAHSHGGNVVLEALPQITTALPSNAYLGKIVTLGTPFMDTMSPILQRIRRNRIFQSGLSRIALVSFILWLVIGALITSFAGWAVIKMLAGVDYGADPLSIESIIVQSIFIITFLIPAVVFAFLIFGISRIALVSFILLLVIGALITSPAGWAGIVNPGRVRYFTAWEDIAAFELDVDPLIIQSIFIITFLVLAVIFAFLLFRKSQNAETIFNGNAQIQPKFLAIGSVMDEPWQLLHHMRHARNPMAVEGNLISYLISSMQAHISRSRQISLIYKAKSYGDLKLIAKLALGATHLVLFPVIFLLVLLIMEIRGFGLLFEYTFFLMLYFLVMWFVIWFVLILLFTRIFGPEFYSAFFAPLRWCVYRIGAIKGIFREIATFIVRSRGWSVVLSIAMGLEGYRHKLPRIEQYPSSLPGITYENMPAGAQQRALATRGAWINRHLDNITQTFSKLVVTSADITLLYRRRVHRPNCGLDCRQG
jgi:hypothetical protein